jgi:uncharacterized small protein (DUF1192 family)
MSQPKRYGIVCDFKAPWSKMHEFEKGEWVQYSDYAALQAEVERLKAETVKQIEAALPPVEAYIAKLEAENERLRAAGDAMADKIRYDEKMLDEDWGVEGREHRTVQAWRAAKGGQP